MSFKIESLTAFISVDEDGEEGLIGLPLGDGILSIPAIAADPVRAKELAVYVKSYAEIAGFEYKVIQLSTRKDITEEFDSTF